ncbi:MAG TPA: substrate-binding domain-containing protein [Burkholderiales bacterium]|nr:substrate-binding domain-containing protein [Burkholderiales bacterium]
MIGILRSIKPLALLCLATVHAAEVHSQHRDQVLIGGVPAVMPLASALAKDFELRVRDVGFVFEKDLGDLRLEAVIEGTLHIAVAANNLDLAFVSREGMVAHYIARSAVVFAVNSGVPVHDLTKQEICDVYSGRVSNWDSLGGPDLAIAPHALPGRHLDAQIARRDIGCLRGMRETGAVTVLGPARMERALAATRGAIGITSPMAVELSGGRLSSISIDGIAPNVDNVAQRRYRMTREIFFVTLSPPSPPVARFLRFVRGPEGDKLIRVNGAVPVK